MHFLPPLLLFPAREVAPLTGCVVRTTYINIFASHRYRLLLRFIAPPSPPYLLTCHLLSPSLPIPPHSSPSLPIPPHPFRFLSVVVFDQCKLSAPRGLGTTGLTGSYVLRSYHYHHQWIYKHPWAVSLIFNTNFYINMRLKQRCTLTFI